MFEKDHDGWDGKKRVTRLTGGNMTAFGSDKLSKSGVKWLRGKIVRSWACAVMWNEGKA